ncbi:MAG: ATP synthase F1 subunit delta [Candidatus Moraniibacteriota bacterium]
MKITATQYAKSLYEVTREKSQNEIGVVIENFVKILTKNRQTKLVVKIIKKFEELYNRESGIAEVEIITRYKIQDTRYKQIEEFIKKKYGAKEVVIENKIDESIKGGIILKIGDEILDASVERQLVELKKSLNH